MNVRLEWRPSGKTSRVARLLYWNSFRAPGCERVQFQFISVAAMWSILSEVLMMGTHLWACLQKKLSLRKDASMLDRHKSNGWWAVLSKLVLGGGVYAHGLEF